MPHQENMNRNDTAYHKDRRNDNQNHRSIKQRVPDNEEDLETELHVANNKRCEVYHIQ